MARKTVKRDVIVERVNAVLRSEDMSDEQKEAVATFAEVILCRSNSYNGYTIPEPGAPISQRTYW